MTRGGDRYDAFIAYRRSIERDRVLAEAVHSALEKYRTPRPLVRKGYPRALKAVFRDNDELAASSNLSRAVEEALDASRYLIVIASLDTRTRSTVLVTMKNSSGVTRTSSMTTPSSTGGVPRLIYHQRAGLLRL